MLVFLIDDEAKALESLGNAVREALPGADIREFSKAAEALNAAQSGDRPDIMFSDIRMPGITGLELALRIKTFSPDVRVIFVTGYSEYTMEAFKVHANGYLTKPVTAEDITEELKYQNISVQENRDSLRVQCFGNFEVFWNEKPLIFKRKKAKELLAYLIDLNGAMCSADEACAVLWEDESDPKKGKKKLRNLLYELNSALGEIGQKDILIRASGEVGVDKSKLDCDYYRMLDGDVDALNSYKGEYMKQFIWAQSTEGRLTGSLI